MARLLAGSSAVDFNCTQQDRLENSVRYVLLLHDAVCRQECSSMWVESMWSFIVFSDRIQQFAAVMGMPMQLNFVGNNLSNAAFVFFIAYLIAEVPIVRDKSSIEEVDPRRLLNGLV